MAGRILSRKKAHREAMLRNLATSVILYERVTTTEAKAKEVRGLVDKMINLGKRDTLAARRQMLAWFPDRLAPKKIWEVLRGRYQDRTSGYTRSVHAGNRKGDNAPVMLVELLAAPKAGASAKTDESVTATADEPKKKLQLRKPKATVTVRRKASSK